MDDKLTSFLTHELERRGWSHRELARRAGVSQTSVSGTLAGDRNPGCDFLIRIAEALDQPPEQLLRLAGILPGSVPEDSALQEILDNLRGMSRPQREEVLKFIRFEKTRDE